MQPLKTTTIKISNETKERLIAAKIHHRETYEDVIIRLLEMADQEQ